MARDRMQHRQAIFQRQLAFWDAAIAYRSGSATATTTASDAAATAATTASDAVATAATTVFDATTVVPTARIHPHNWNVHPTPPRDEEAGLEYLAEYLSEAEEYSDVPSDDANDEDYFP